MIEKVELEPSAEGNGLDARLEHETGMPIVIAPNPLFAVAIGSGQSLEEFDALKGVLFSSTIN